MTRNRRNKQQWRRIRTRQRQRHGSSGDPPETDRSPTPDVPGPATDGVISCHYGQQLEVQYEQTGRLETIRCYQRANLPALATGDRVTWHPLDHESGVITALQPRRNVLARPDERSALRPMAANVDVVVIVLAPRPRPFAGLIDRYLAAMENLRLSAILLVNKADRTDTGETTSLLATYTDIGYPVLRASCHQPDGTRELKQYLRGRTAVFMGQSGVGKSSLINQLLTAAGKMETATIGGLSTGAEKGRHTTTTARLYQLPDAGAVIDSPGIRDFGLWHMDREALLDAFVEFRPHLGHCRFRDCRHNHEPGCALQEAVRAGKISQQRLDSFFHIEAERHQD